MTGQSRLLLLRIKQRYKYTFLARAVVIYETCYNKAAERAGTLIDLASHSRAF